MSVSFFNSRKARWFALAVLFVIGYFVVMNISLFRNKIENIVLRNKPYENSVSITRQEYDALKVASQSCKQLGHLTIVLINTGGEVHKQIRNLVGSIHRHHEHEVLIYVYGLDLDESSKNEIYLWKNVEYWDIKDLYLAAENIDRNLKISPDLWKPTVFAHSASRLGKFLYIQPGYYLSKKLELAEMETYLEQYGSFFASPNCKSSRSAEEHLNIATSFDVAIHGVQLNSFAYNNFYLPMGDCSRSKCSKAQMKALDMDVFSKMSDEQKKGMYCQDLDSFTSAFVNSPPSESACYIINREDFIISPTQLPGFPAKSWVAFTPQKDDTGLIKQSTDNRIHVALGIPTTSKGHNHVNENPLLRVLIPSLKRTIAKKGTDEGDRFVYKIYLAIDRGDPVYDNPTNQKVFKDLVAKEMEEYNFHFQIIRVINSHGWVPMLWNTVFQHAIDDGADYFYQLNDDVGFISPGWTQMLIDRLVNNPRRKNFGVTGPTDEGNRSIFTQAFVHRTHHQIFGFFYPYIFKNWYSDDWVSLVYRDTDSYFKDPHQPLVRNQQTFGTRYDVCAANGRDNLNKVLEISKAKIKEFLETTTA